MIGYGSEATNFALELTYNYGIDGYEFGNDLQYIAMANPSALIRAAALGYNTVGNVIQGNLFLTVHAFPVNPSTHNLSPPSLFSTIHSCTLTSTGPDSYKYKIVPRIAGRAETFVVVALRVANLARAVGYWRDILGMREVTGGSSSLLQVICCSS